MSGTIVPLAEVAEVKLGRQRSPKNHDGPSMRKYLRAANVGWSGLLLDDVKEMNFTDTELAQFRLEPGDILLNEASGSPREVGKPALWQGELDDCAFQNTLLRVRPSDQVDSRYLLHFFRREAESGEFVRGSRGTGINHLGRAALAQWSIPLPPIEEQRRIAAILDHADVLRAKRREALARLDELTQSIFVDMFGDPVLNTLDWPVHSLVDVLTRPLQNGAYFPKEKYTNGGTEMVHMGDVFYDVVERGSLRRVDCGPEEIAKYGLDMGDLLIARRSLNHSGAAKPCLVPNSDDPLLFESSLIRATPDPMKATVGYLFHLLSNERFRKARIHPIVTGATISGVSQTNLASLEVPVPPAAEQLRMNEAMEGIDQLRARHSSAQVELDALFASLQSRAFRGEL